MAISIALFSHKGGVSKTTTCFHLGWMLAGKGHRVLLVDCDPQCNLTGLVLGFRGPDEFDHFYTKHASRNVRAGLAPAFESQPKLIEAVDCVEVEGRTGLYLLPGHIQLSEYDTTLNLAQELSGSITALKNVPGSIYYLIAKTSNKYDADVILIDMNPGLSPINQNLVMTSDYFIVPTSPDYFSVMALNSMASFLPKWHNWYATARNHPVLQNADYQLPNTTSKFLGLIIQNFRPRDGRPASAFQRWIDALGEAARSKLIPNLTGCGMALPAESYTSLGIPESRCLEMIANFNSLIAKSHEMQKPVFMLSKEEVGQVGSVWQTTEAKIDDFFDVYSNLADRGLELTDGDGLH